jgi:Fe-S cluster assembly protein SufD
LAGYKAIEGLIHSFGPSELAPLRLSAREAFERVGLPTRRDEEFKYTPLRQLDEQSYAVAYGATVGREELPYSDLDAFHIVFVNGQPAPELTTPKVLPEGVVVTSLTDAWETLPAHVTDQLGQIATLDGRLGSTNDERFKHLNTAHLTDGAVIYVPRNVTVEDLIAVHFLTKADHGPLVAHPRLLVVLEENAEIRILESHIGIQGEAFNNAVVEVSLGSNARLEHVRLQEESSDTNHVGATYVRQSGHSVYRSVHASYGGLVSRHDLNVWVGGERCETWLDGAYIGLGDQVSDHHTRIDHAFPNCNSFEVYKGILGGKSRGVFNGKIFVYLDAQKTDAKQTNQALLLSPEASIDTKPQLEIFADDVKCTHGATVGQLREDSMFYLRSRGIPEAQAKALLVYAFAAEVLEKISHVGLRETLEKRLYDKLEA